MPALAWTSFLKSPRRTREPLLPRFRAVRLFAERLEDRDVPATFIVTTNSDAVSHTGLSLRDAIVQAESTGEDDTIVFDASLAGATITLAQGQLLLSNAASGAIAIDGGGLSSPIAISGNNASRVFLVDSGVQASFNGLIIQGGKVTDAVGAGISNLGSLTVSNSTLSGNAADNGGGIHNTGMLTLSNAAFTGNSANHFIGTTENNGGLGGGLYNSGSVTATNVTFSSNLANSTSGGFGSCGGGIFNKGTLTATHATLSTNAGGTGGGGIYNGGTLAISDAIVSGNTASFGSGIHTVGLLTVNAATFAGNSSQHGGGIMNGIGGLNGYRSFDDNRAGRLTVTNSTFSFNSATGWFGSGGGVSADSLGSSSVTIWNSTFSGNTADKYGGGLAVASGQARVSNCTFSGNTAFEGGGIFASNSSTTLRNTIVAGNTSTYPPSVTPDGRSHDVKGNLNAASAHNLIGIGNGMTGITNGDANGNMVGSFSFPFNPRLNPLANNGGPTQTMSLRSGSPAISRGSSIGNLAVGIDAAATIITVSDGATIGSTPGEYRIEIGGEIMTVRNVSGNNLTVIRGTNATAHDGATVIYIPFDQRGAFRPGAIDIGAFERGAVLPNHAPVLDPSASPSLPSTKEDRVSASVSVASLLGTSVTDLNLNPLEGIAVTAVGGNGTWQYSLDGGLTYRNFGSPSESAARLLRSSDRIRFVPARDFNGDSNITYRAWDRTAGLAGGTFNIVATGGSTAFSETFETAQITVTPVNDAPLLLLGTPLLPAIQVNDPDPDGSTVGDLAGGLITDVDAGAVEGIAVIRTSGGASGQWQFSTNSGTDWTTFGTVSSRAARLLDANHKVRFLPNPDYTLMSPNSALPSITYRAWDQTTGSAGQTTKVTATGGTTAFSRQLQSAGVKVNDAPILSPAAPDLGTISPNKTFVTTIAALLGNSVQDLGIGTRQGIAITRLTTTGGKWQFSTNGGMTYRDFGTVGESSALLLRPTDRLRFVPLGFTGAATVIFRAWDQTSGAAGKVADLSGAGAVGDRSAFSSSTDTGNLQIA